jgi:AAA family ATP:ADP antiporter
VKEIVGATYSRFYLFTNVATVLLQSFVVSRFVRKFGMRTAFLALPIVPLIDAVGVGVAPLLSLLFAGKVVENAADYSLNNTLRNMLWLPTTREMKYKAKQAVDTFFVRFGDVTSAVCVYLITSAAGFGIRGIAAVSAAACIGWVFVARTILDQRERLSTASVPPRPADRENKAAEAAS